MSDQAIDTTEYSADVEVEDQQVTETVEAGERQETVQAEKDSGGDDSGNDYVETDDPKVIARFGHLTRKATEAERKALALQRQIDELQSKQKQSESQQQTPLQELSAPDPDLAIDNPEEFKRQQRAYVDYVREDERRSYQGEQQKKQSEAQKMQALQQRVTTYVERADKIGIAKEALADAGNAIEQFMSEDLRDTILMDEDGPALTVYLHENVSDLSALLEASKESPYRAGQAIERLRGKLKTAKKPKSDLPPPPTTVRGTRSSGKAEDGTLYE
jgi:hypothetical protein